MKSIRAYYLPIVLLIYFTILLLLCQYVLNTKLYVVVLWSLAGYHAYQSFFKTKKLESDEDYELSADQRERLNVIVIGAGFSGICIGVKLKKEGIPFRIVEKEKEIGGTWNANRYPGSSCDTPSWLYQFSFRVNIDINFVFRIKRFTVNMK